MAILVEDERNSVQVNIEFLTQMLQSLQCLLPGCGLSLIVQLEKDIKYVQLVTNQQPQEFVDVVAALVMRANEVLLMQAAPEGAVVAPELTTPPTSELKH